MQTELTLKTDYYGVLLGAMAGNLVGVGYDVWVEVPNTGVITTQLFLIVRGERGWNNYIPDEIFVDPLEITTSEGIPANAAKAGQQLKKKLAAAFFRLEDTLVMEGPGPCTLGNATITGYSLRSKGIVNKRRITDGIVTFQTVTGDGQASQTESNNGLYLATYTTGTARKNTVEVRGEATVAVPEVLYDQENQKIIDCYATATLPTRTVQLRSSQRAVFDRYTNTRRS